MFATLGVKTSEKDSTKNYRSMQSVTIEKCAGLTGTVQLPADKSISHRAAMIAAIAEGTTTITNFAESADCASTLACLSALNVPIERNGSTVVVKGVGKQGFTQPKAALDCGNSGTTMRLLSGIVAGMDIAATFDGDESLRSRPMRRVIDPLEKMGAKITSEDGRAPFTIRGTAGLKAIEYEPPSASAQIKSCVLLAGLNAAGETSVIERTPTRNHTERMLRRFGVDVGAETLGSGGERISTSGEAKLSAADIEVPSDISAASFFVVAAACLPGSDILLQNVGVNLTRRSAIDVIAAAGADVKCSGLREISGEPVADIQVFGDLRDENSGTVRLEGGVIANLIDEIPILAIFGTQLRNGLEVRGAAELRVKESDRIKAVVRNLKLMDASVEEFPDGFRVERSDLKGAAIDSFGDHRIAMAFAVAGLLAEGKTEIAGAECVDVSFPGFFEVLARATG